MVTNLLTLNTHIMKTTYLKVLTVIMMMVITFSCVENNLHQAQELNQSELMKTGKDLAVNHNECLAKIFGDLTKVKTRTTLENYAELQNMIISSANDYITLNDDVKNRIENSDFEITIEEIRESVSEKELFYIEEAISMEKGDSFNTLLEDVESDSELNEERKLAVMCFITTLEASIQYWSEHLDEWLELVNRPQTRATFKSIAFADAWWGFQGMLMSGLNPVAGGGMAAVASAGTAIWGRAEMVPKEEDKEPFIKEVPNIEKEVPLIESYN